ncbi:MAG TPA: hypothetical protein VGM01_09335 [Ktedonobacteraceae bacterium]
MFTKVFRLLLIVVVVGALIWFLAPRVLNSAANSIISSSGSQAQGLAQFVPASAGSSPNAKGDLQVNLTGLTPNTTYEVSLDQGQCGSPNTDLGPAKSDANGNFYIELPMNALNNNQTWYIDVLQQGQSVACGQLQTDQNASAQAISAGGPNVFGPQPTQGTQGQTDTPTTSSSSVPNSTTSSTLPNLPVTGVNSGGNQQYDNNQYPRKY